MDVDVLTDIEIDRPRSEVADYVSNPDNATTWYENITKVEWKSPKPLQVGSKVAFEAQFMGQKLEYTYEITEYVPGEWLVMSAASGALPDGDRLQVLRHTERWDQDGASQPRTRPGNGKRHRRRKPQRSCSTEVNS